MLTYQDLKDFVNGLNHDQLSDPVMVVRPDKMVVPISELLEAGETVEGVNVGTGRYEKLLEEGQVFLA